MEFRIADTFTDSLARLTGEEQKAVKTTAFDLQLNPSNPGMQFHKLDKARDKRFWSVRVSKDLRIIVHRTASSLMLCYVGHHDDAYRWAERRKLETHPKTGAAQLVEIREIVRQVAVPQYVRETVKPLLFADISDEQLMNYGVPEEWLGEVRRADEDTLLELADHLPAEATEALLNLAVGVTPEIVQPAAAVQDPFEHPDARRRFRVMHNIEELERALEYTWEKWIIFLHPTQRQLVEGYYNGPARISGSAGTGKTIVALHRAVYLARTNPDARVLLTTFNETLANALRAKLKLLIGNEPRIGERVEVYAIKAIARRLYELNFGKPKIASRKAIRNLIREATRKLNQNQFHENFLIKEWEEVIDAWQLDSWEAYRDVMRLGRKTRLTENQRARLWSIFEHVRSSLQAEGFITYSSLFGRLTSFYSDSKNLPFDFCVVDEVQDISISQLRFLAALGTGRANSLFFTGDLGQRIFQPPFSWKALGIDIRGRSRTLRINYRTSHQIRRQADRLLGPELSDVDGNTELRKGTISIFNGPDPIVSTFNTQNAEVEAVSNWLRERINSSIKPHEIGVFVRSTTELERACAAVKNAGLQFIILDNNVETTSNYISVGTMHLAKGLEFRAVAVMACDDEVIPLQERIETAADALDLEEVYNTERHLLYVACTRARDHLLVTGVNPASEFLDDLLA
ncbi:MAG: UvrD-helicase domain-containing protein [Phycisphaerae bacterium]|jgi:mRNA-degrading endonuclease RelE of RelBE toxin-antitoxin system|nr:3'-5' exonuclease [Bacillota bacterium]